MLPPYAASQATASEPNSWHFIPAGTVQVWRSWLKTLVSYSAARDGRPCGVSGHLGARGWAAATTTASQERQHAGWMEERVP